MEIVIVLRVRLYVQCGVMNLSEEVKKEYFLYGTPYIGF